MASQPGLRQGTVLTQMYATGSNSARGATALDEPSSSSCSLTCAEGWDANLRIEVANFPLQAVENEFAPSLDIQSETSPKPLGINKSAQLDEVRDGVVVDRMRFASEPRRF
jgi:hypothetical protein